MGNSSQRSAGYSGKPLSDKLGIKAGHRFSMLNGPDCFEVEGLPEPVEQAASLQSESDIVLFFTKSAADLDASFQCLIDKTVDRGSIWIAWPKKSSGVQTDLTEDVIRDVGLALGVVDVKVCAVDEVWSGLKFVRRLPAK